MPATCSKNPPQKNPSDHPIGQCPHRETCGCGKNMGSGDEIQGSQVKADAGLLSDFGYERASSSSFQRSHQDSKPRKEHSNNCLHCFTSTGINNYSSPGLIVQRTSHPLSIRSITSCISNPPTLNLPHRINQIEIPNFVRLQNNEFNMNSRNCTTLILGSTRNLHQISLFHALLGLPNNVLQSLCPPNVSRHHHIHYSASTFQLGHQAGNSDASSSDDDDDDNGFRNETQIDLWRQLLMDSTLYIHRPGDINLLEASATSFFVVTPNHGLNFRLLTENSGVSYQRSLHVSIETRSRSGAMWVDVDNMSYEELLALQDHIGYVSTGLSEEAAVSSLKRSNYFLFEEENGQKDFCSICQEDFVEEDELGTLDCGHGFHIACIKQWLGYRNVCPICKSPVLYSTRPSFAHIQSQ